jgi:uncharacterized membrane protein
MLNKIFNFFKGSKKALYKTLSWRIIGTILTAAIVYFGFGNMSAAIAIGAIDSVIKLVAYFFHEVLWDKYYKT